MWIRAVVFLVLTLTSVQSWNKCVDEPFCDRIRNQAAGDTLQYYIEPNSMAEGPTGFQEWNLVNRETEKVLKLKVLLYKSNGIGLIQVDDPENNRKAPEEALAREEREIVGVTHLEDGYASFRDELVELRVYYDPFYIVASRDNETLIEFNKHGKLTFNIGDDQSIAGDFTFPGATRAYGIPSHAEDMSLQTTTDGLDPYRLFNTDHCCFNPNTQYALYGSIPVLYAHGTKHSSGVFWLNSAQTFVDITKNDNSVDALFISETGLLDVYLLIGKNLPNTVKQYSKLTGAAPLPPYYSIAYHQSRWSYMSQEDAETVVAEFDNHDFPLDVLWLDIDYTDGFRYFTWDYENFPDPTGMQLLFNSTGRRLVVIIDPHIKVDDEYHIYQEGKANGYFVHNPNGTVFEGECWPGMSSYIDFLNPDALTWYSNNYALDKFPDSTHLMSLWNDMNEPSVFDGPEGTMPRDLIHYDNIVHRDVHNIYGFYQTMGTHKGLLDRSPHQRPFILTRSHFAGTQRYAAIWTGDNMSNWAHLKLSFSMCLTEALAGISFCGADVGGFGWSVEDELFQRWYQAGAWLPFFRAHSSMNSYRREPYLYEEEMQGRIRNAIRERYFHLPYWYLVWFEHERYGEPVIRPLTYQYQDDENTLDIDQQWLIGSDIMVSPVTEKAVSDVQIYFPGGINELWYDIKEYGVRRGLGYFTVPVDLDYFPVFYKGGSIIPRKDVPRPSTVHTHDDLLSLYVFLDVDGKASGNVYVDDGISFEYQQIQNYGYYKFTYENHYLVGLSIDGTAYDGWAMVYETLVYGIGRSVTGAFLVEENGRRMLDITIDEDIDMIRITNINVSVKDLRIELV